MVRQYLRVVRPSIPRTPTERKEVQLKDWKAALSKSYWKMLNKLARHSATIGSSASGMLWSIATHMGANTIKDEDGKVIFRPPKITVQDIASDMGVSYVRARVVLRALRKGNFVVDLLVGDLVSIGINPDYESWRPLAVKEELNRSRGKRPFRTA